MMAFDSTDWIDDAIESLESSRFPWLLVIGFTENLTRVESNMEMDDDNLEAVVECVKAHFEENAK